MNGVKVKLSAKEFDLMIEADFILTKNSVIHKVNELFANLYTAYKSVLEEKHDLPKYLQNSSFKIAKGEQYLALPWVMMDYPKLFSGKDIFAIRSFFWWGNCFSITLHISGTYFQKGVFIAERLLEKNTDWLFCVHQHQWHHHFEADNYQPLQAHHLANISERSFIKLAKKIPLQEWDNAVLFFEQSFKELIAVMPPNDEIVL